MSCGQASCSIARSFLVARRKENEVWRREWGVKGCAFMTAMDAVDVLIAVIIDLPVFLPLDWSIRGLVTFFHWLSHGLVEQARQSKNWLWTFDPLANYESLKKLILISFKVILSIDFLTVHSQLLSRRFQKCLGEFLRWFFRMIFSRSWDPKFRRSKHGQIHHFAMLFPLASGRFKTRTSSWPCSRRAYKLPPCCARGALDSDLSSEMAFETLHKLGDTWIFEPDMIQWRKTYVQDESRDAYSNFRLCCNSDPWLDLG